MIQTTGLLLMAGMALLSQASSAQTARKAGLARVYGRIQFVTSGADYKVKVVEAFADLHVKKVGGFPDRPGLWKIVTNFPDYKIQVVESFPDFTIKYVESFPGVR